MKTKRIRGLVASALLALCVASHAMAAVSSEDLTILKVGPSGLYYEDVAHIEGLSSDDLYSRALAWMAVNYRSSKAAIQLEDKEGNRIIGHGVFELRGGLTVPHTISFEARDGRYKLRIDGLSAFSADTRIGNQPFPGVTYKEISDAPARIVSRVEAEIGTLADNLKTALQQPANDDW